MRGVLLAQEAGTPLVTWKFMGKLSHLTPRYIVNRLKWGIYQRRNAEKPWLTPAANQMLSTLLRPDDIGLEWGSGRSTCWLARHLGQLTSVEDHKEWHAKVSNQIQSLGLKNVQYQLAAHPAPGEEERGEYVRVCDRFADASLTFALVDGQAREYCANAVLPKLAPGGVLVIDNINWFLDHPTHSPASRAGKGPLNDTWAKFQRATADWRMIWTTSGVTDTALWFKPVSKT
jgi:predicted O-methyltransferase YrrM